jgi:hypothetical protein
MRINEAGLRSIQRLFVEVIGKSEWDEEFCAGPKKIFTPILTIWLMMLQSLSGGSMKSALGELMKGAADVLLEQHPRGGRAKYLSTNTGGFSHAKSRLTVEEVDEKIDLLNEGLSNCRSAKKGSSISNRVKILDGTTFFLERTAAIEASFPRGRNVRGELNHPELRVVFATDALSGVMTKPQFGPMRGPKATSEQGLCAKVLEEVESGTLLVGDRNFGVFSVVSHASRYGNDVLFRLIDKRARKFIKDESSTGSIDKHVIWKKSTDDQLLDPKDPQEVAGRIIRTTLKSPGFRPLTLVLFTTTDLPVKELVKLYGRRVDIETDIRYLKHMFTMERFLSKTPDSLKKELLIRFCATNLMRIVVAEAAECVGLLPREVSFSSAVMYTRIFGEKIARASSDKERDELYARYLVTIRQSRLPKRKKQRHEPRKVTLGRTRYRVLREPRKEAKKNIIENQESY